MGVQFIAVTRLSTTSTEKSCGIATLAHFPIKFSAIWLKNVATAVLLLKLPPALML